MLIGKILLALAIVLQQISCQVYTGPEDPRIKTALTLEVPTNGVSTTPDGRLFLVLARVAGTKGPLVVEYNLTTEQQTPYPNLEWNSWALGKDPSTHFVRINAQSVGPDGHLYAVDISSPKAGEPVILPGGPKIVQINVQENTVSRVFHLDNVTRTSSNINDIRFNAEAGKAYITDSGSPGVIVLDLESGISRRILEADSSTKGVSAFSAEGALLYDYPGNKFDWSNTDQLEVSPNGQYLYYQPNNGCRLSRIETKYMDEALYNTSLSGEDRVAAYSEPFALTPSTGGTAIDAEGKIYVSNVDSQLVFSIAPNGTKTILVQDSRLLWVDAM